MSFNPKLVRLEVRKIEIFSYPSRRFQSQTGAIRSDTRELEYKGPVEFQSQTGAIRSGMTNTIRGGMVSFNPKLVRLEDVEAVEHFIKKVEFQSQTGAIRSWTH